MGSDRVGYIDVAWFGVRERVDDYLAVLTAERGLSSNTIAAYRRDLDQYLEFVGDRVPDAEVIDAFVTHLRSLDLAHSTVARKVASVRGFHRFELVDGVTDDDPSALLDPPQRRQSLPKALTVEQTLALLDAIPLTDRAGVRDSALLEFIYATGSRVSEAIGVDLGHIDLVDRVVVVTGKGRKQRMVPLGSGAVDAIQRWLPPRLETARESTDALFLNLRGARLSRQGVFAIVRKRAEMVGIEASTVSPHVLRHSAATHMVEGGADLRTVQEMLGHANVSTTQIYTRVSPQHLLEVYTLAHPRSR